MVTKTISNELDYDRFMTNRAEINIGLAVPSNVGREELTLLPNNGEDIFAGSGATDALGSDSDRAPAPGATDLDASGARRTGTEGSDTLVGGAGRDHLNGLGGDDVLIGNAGDDRLDGGTGDDRMQGGIGNDTYIVDSLGDKVEEGVNAGTDTVRTALSTYSLGANVENLRFEGTGGAVGVGNALANTIVGTSAADTLQSLAGDDRLVGGGGNDVLIGGSGRDVLEGGAGADRFVFFNGESTVATPDRIRDFDVDGGDVIDLSSNAAAFIGTDGFSGQGTGEIRYQRQGGSTLVSGDLDGNGSADFAITLDGAKTLTEADFRLAGFTRTGTEGADTLIGGAADDTLIGLGGDDVLIGNAGNDVLDGGVGNDSLQGGTGDDTYIVDGVDDRVQEGVNAGIDTVRTTSEIYTLGANLEVLQFDVPAGGFGAFGVGNALANTITGTALNDTLNGLAGDDRLVGGDGNDVLIGSSGRDVLEGGGGADQFRFFQNETSVAAPDTIRDFEEGGGDVIDLSGLGSLDFVGTGQFSGQGAGELRYEQQEGSTIVLGDLDGNGGADFAIALDGNKVLVEANFLLMEASASVAADISPNGDFIIA